jgi:hypothetical protein
VALATSGGRGGDAEVVETPWKQLATRKKSEMSCWARERDRLMRVPEATKRGRVRAAAAVQWRSSLSHGSRVVK